MDCLKEIWWLIGFLFLIPRFGEAGTIVKDGKPVVRIVLAKEPTAQAREAAAELQNYLERMSGARVPTTEEAAGLSGPLLFVGQTEASRSAGLPRSQAPSREFNGEWFAILTRKESILLAGNEAPPYQGTFYAVSEFLERLGCRWYFPGEFGEVIPKRSTIVYRGPDLRMKPSFRLRDVWYSGWKERSKKDEEEFALWKRHVKCCHASLLLNPMTGAAPYLQSPADDSVQWLVPPSRYLKEHPEYFALSSDGKRLPDYPCITSPKVLSIALNTIADYYREHPDHYSIGFAPPDGHMPVLPGKHFGDFGGEGWGNISDQWYDFVFRLADEMEKRHPEKLILTMAYSDRLRPPEGVEWRKRENLLMTIADIQDCYVHSFGSRSCPLRQRFARLFRNWSELSLGTIYRGYDPFGWDFLEYPNWLSQQIQEDLRFLQGINAWGTGPEGMMNWLPTGLNYYVRAKLSWDMRLKPKELISDFCRNFFGPAAQPMNEYYNQVEKQIRDSPSHTMKYVYTPEFVRSVSPLITKALSLASREPHHSRVRAFAGHYERLRDLVFSHEAACNADFRKAIEHAEDAVAAVGRVGNPMLLQSKGLTRSEDEALRWISYYKNLLPFVNGEKAELVARFPVRCWFRADLPSQGVLERYYAEQPSAAKGWSQFRTDRPWSAQGYVDGAGEPYTGVAWYSAEVEIPEDATHRPVRMFAPDATLIDESWVWANGRIASYRSPGANFDHVLSDCLQRGSNHLVIRVVGRGGFTTSPFLYSPRQGLTEWPPVGSACGWVLAKDAGPYKTNGYSDMPTFGPLAKTHVEIAELPKKGWLFKRDPTDRGKQEKWYSPETKREDWGPIEVDEFWENQGYDYDGVAWYALTWTPPRSAEGKRLILAVGAADEEAWVWVNGRAVGEHCEGPDGWDKMFSMDVTSCLKPGIENLIVIRVYDRLAVGGLWKPIKLFAQKE